MPVTVPPISDPEIASKVRSLPVGGLGCRPTTEKRATVRSFSMRVASVRRSEVSAAAWVPTAAAAGSSRAWAAAWAELATSTISQCGRCCPSQRLAAVRLEGWPKTRRIASIPSRAMRQTSMGRGTSAQIFRECSEKRRNMSRTAPSVEFSMGTTP